jgi:D-beta-D-heptose 7-phosphate kinase/D-beta-D-heptose 1-phosphate adenosyltransferase
MNKKVTGLKHLKSAVNRKKGIVFTNGCFDVLHYGHVRYLDEAKAKGNILIVGLNSDRSVRKLKGKNRPINPQSERAGVLAALESVDYIVLFDEDTPIRLIETLRPDVLVKGGDWSKKKIVGADIVRSYGGKILTIPFVKNLSTTNTLKKLIVKLS